MICVMIYTDFGSRMVLILIVEAIIFVVVLIVFCINEYCCNDRPCYRGIGKRRRRGYERVIYDSYDSYDMYRYEKDA